MILPCLFVAPSQNRGRGVFTSEILDHRQVIEISPVLVVTAAERALMDKTRLHDYLFEWGNLGDAACVAWGYLSLYNHAAEPNCTYEMDYDHDLITILTLRKVLPGEELFINYLSEESAASSIWFPVQ